MEKKVRIKLDDLPEEKKIDQAELRRVMGGTFRGGFYWRFGLKPRGTIYGEGPCYDKTFCY